MLCVPDGGRADRCGDGFGHGWSCLLRDRLRHRLRCRFRLGCNRLGCNRPLRLARGGLPHIRMHRRARVRRRRHRGCRIIGTRMPTGRRIGGGLIRGQTVVIGAVGGARICWCVPARGVAGHGMIPSPLIARWTCSASLSTIDSGSHAPTGAKVAVTKVEIAWY